MQREPSLHITETNLQKLLVKVLGEQHFYIDPQAKDYPHFIATLTNEILTLGKNYAPSHRKTISSTKALDQKISRVNASTKSDASLFSQLLLLERRRMKHRGVEIIKPGDREWLELKAIAHLATEFSKEFSLPRRQGYIEYIRIALSKINKYGINKIKNLHPAICSCYDAIDELSQDTTPQETNEVYLLYTKAINEVVGFDHADYKNNPEKYVCFKRAKDSAVKIGIGFDIYVKAQFFALEYCNGIPDPHQLYGDKALERVRKYCFEKKISLTPKKVIDLSRIKR